MNRIRVTNFFLLLMLAACSSQSKSDKLTKELETVSSWTATADMVAEAWMQGTVPEAYAKRTLESTEQELSKEEEKLAQEFAQHPQLPKQVQQLEQITKKMTLALKQKNKSALSQYREQLDTTQQELDKLIKAQVANYE